MNERACWVRRRVCVAVLVAAAALLGCGAENEDAGEEVPADDDFQHAHVLAPEDRQAKEVADATGPDLSRGWGPVQFQRAYNLPALQSNKPPGYGTKVAIITAYHYSNLQHDLNVWAQYFGIKPFTLIIINQAGIVSNSNWALTSALAVQMLNTVSPGATVYVIEAKSVGQLDMRTAMSTAVNLGVHVISMPFGASETGSQSYATSLGANANVVWIAASGSTSAPSFPATHPGVIAVGGTTAQLDATNALQSETAWRLAGAGMSLVADMPSFQKIPSVQKLNTTAHRSIPDVAFHADPDRGAAVYASILGGWYRVGGTAVSTMLFAGVVALADTSRRFQSKPMLSSTSGHPTLQDSLYGLMSTHGGPTSSTILNDVVAGSAGDGGYPAGPGYDVATGLGSLDVQQFIDYMTAQ